MGDHHKHVFSIISQNPIHPSAPLGVWKTEDWVYDKIRSLPEKNSITLETGAGSSTLFFALSKSKKHYCLLPSQDEADKIRSVSLMAQIPLDNVEFIVASSVKTLIGFSDLLDFVLIDGCHGPFLPFLDFYFSVKNLRPGGHVLIDDINLISPKILFEFIKNEPAVEVLYQTKKAVLIKIKNNSFLDHDWWQSSLNYSSEDTVLSELFLSKCIKHR